MKPFNAGSPIDDIVMTRNTMRRSAPSTGRRIAGNLPRVPALVDDADEEEEAQ
jgi:hypothetical protein